ncbi:MAG TPA: MFS transporter [Mycobacteriales bacterium]|nr:MFS transporter [Mycobacteriales bacterium]
MTGGDGVTTDAAPSAAGQLAPRALRPVSRALALAALCLLLFLTFLDNTVVSVALGQIQSELHASVGGLQWVVDGYALVFASVMLPAAAIGDEFGRKTVLLSGAAVFCAGSIVCGLATSVGWLLAGRVIMGFGAAGSEPGTLSMIRQLYPSRRARNRAVGVWAAVSGLALALGPVLGGVLVALGGWRSIFWFNLALGALALLVGLRLLPESADPDGHRVDAAGALLAAGALACAVFAVIIGETDGYDSSQVLALFVVAAVTAVVFLIWERHAAHPLIDPALFRLPVFITANIAAFAVYFGAFALFFFTALYLDVVVGENGYQIALQFLPLTGGMVLAALVTGRLSSRTGPQAPVVGGCLLFGAGLVLTRISLGPHPDYAPLAGSLLLAGVGLGAAVVSLTTAVLDVVPAERSGLAASATNTSRELGAVVGVAVLGAIVDARLTGGLSAEINRLGLGSFQQLILSAVEHGGLPSNSQAAGVAGSAGGADSGLAQQVLNAAYSAFASGLRISLLLSAGLVLLAAGLAAVGMRPAGGRASR